MLGAQRGGGGCNGVGETQKLRKKEIARKKLNRKGGDRGEIGRVRQMEWVIGHHRALGQLFFDILVDTMT